MKRFYKVLFMLLIFSSVFVAYAVRLEGEITVTDNIFSKKGHITSFDINSEGDILICVDQAYTDNWYIMIFREDGSLIHTFEMRYFHELTAAFSEDENIVLYGGRSPIATVFNENGEILYEYDENYYQERQEAGYTDLRYYGEIAYQRNRDKNQIIKYPNGYRNGGEEVLYEMISSERESLIFLFFALVCMILFAVFVVNPRAKEMRQKYHVLR